MQNFWLELFFWTFFIYGLVLFIDMIWLDLVYYVAIGIQKVYKYIKNWLIKISQKYIINAKR